MSLYKNANCLLKIQVKIKQWSGACTCSICCPSVNASQIVVGTKSKLFCITLV
jgi:hypothetical protein